MSTEDLATQSDELLKIAGRVKRAFGQFVIVWSLKIIAGLAFLSAYTPADPRSAWPYAIAGLVLIPCLIASYAFMAIRLTSASRQLGQSAGGILGWFVALPVILVLLSLSGPGPELGGFGGAVGFWLSSALLASPIAIWLSIKRELDRRIERSLSL